MGWLGFGAAASQVSADHSETARLVRPALGKIFGDW